MPRTSVHILKPSANTNYIVCVGLAAIEGLLGKSKTGLVQFCLIYYNPPTWETPSVRPGAEPWLAQNVGHCYNKSLNPILAMSSPWLGETLLFRILCVHLPHHWGQLLDYGLLLKYGLWLSACLLPRQRYMAQYDSTITQFFFYLKGLTVSWWILSRILSSTKFFTCRCSEGNDPLGKSIWFLRLCTGKVKLPECKVDPESLISAATVTSRNFLTSTIVHGTWKTESGVTPGVTPDVTPFILINAIHWIKYSVQKY